MAAVHYGADYGFDLGVPTGGEWHTVTSDLAESRLGLIPDDPTSFFKATVTRNAATGSVTVTWPSQQGLEFDVWWTDDLSKPKEDWLNFGPITDNDGGPTHSYEDLTAGSEPRGFYQVELKP